MAAKYLCPPHPLGTCTLSSGGPISHVLRSNNPAFRVTPANKWTRLAHRPGAREGACRMRFAKTTTKLCACLGPFCSLGSAVTSPPPCWLRARRRGLGVTALPQPPKSQVLQAAIVPAEDLMRKALHHVDCCQQRSIPLYSATHTSVACVRIASHVEADLWRCCSLRRGPAQARKVPYGKVHKA